MAKGYALSFIMTIMLLCGWGCEKDDICVDGDTPLLILRFYDSQDTSQLKKVASLRVVGLGQGSAITTFTDRSTLDSISLPLKSDSSETSFVFILNSADDNGAETGNQDTLRFTYNTKEVFISRACGFVTNYNSLLGTPPADASPWIENMTIVNPDVESQTAAHVKIFH